MSDEDTEIDMETTTDFADFEKGVMHLNDDDSDSEKEDDHDDSTSDDDDDSDDNEEEKGDESEDEDEGGDEDEGEGEEGDEDEGEGEGEGGNEDEDEDEKDKGRKKKKSVQQRIAELTKKRREAERAAKEATEKLIAAQERAKALEEAKEKEGASAPDPNDEKYRYGEVDEQYLEDLAQFKADKLFAEKQAEKAKEDADKVAADRVAYFEGKMKDLETDGITKYDDFEQSLADIESGDVPLTFTMAELMLESKHGADVVHALASDPAEATRISQLSPLRQAAEFGKIEAKFSRSPAKSSAKQGRKKSRAPTPPKRRARGKGGKFAPDGSTTDFAAFEKMANSQE